MKPVISGNLFWNFVLFQALCVCFSLSNAFAAYQTITNDVWWKDNNGNPIYAQGGGISKFGGTYYWYGIAYTGAVSYYNTPPASGAVTFSAINCYRSTDLVSWTFVTNSITAASSHLSGWVGRMGQVVYNNANSQYVMWFQGGGGQTCCTCSAPDGRFVVDHTQTDITNVYYAPVTGDSTLFCDVDHGSTPYLIFSDSHGRQHAYISQLSADYKTILPATAINDTGGIPAWPQGQEANNMFERNGIYYYLTSNLAGWSYSSAYAVWSPGILTPNAYTADAAFAGTTADNTRYSQVSFAFQVAGTQATNYLMVGDRWADFDNTYYKAGFGSNYAVFCPITFTNNTPYFNSMHMFQIDTVTGKWRTATTADAPTNLTATAGDTQVSLSWTALDGATAYNVMRSTSNGGPYLFIALSATNSYRDTAVTNGLVYFYTVSSTNLFGDSTNSAQVSAAPSIGPLIAMASINPNPAYPGQNVMVSATVAAQVNPIGIVTVDVSAIGGLTNQTLVSDRAGSYTNWVVVGVTTPVRSHTLTVNASDTSGNISSPYPLILTIGTVNETWDGEGDDSNWSDALNWAGGVPPGFNYSLVFAGLTRLAPEMDSAFNLYSLTFNNTAGAFTISATNGGTLTLSGGATNNSPNAQALNVPLMLFEPATINAATADLTLGQMVNNGGNLLSLTDGGHSIMLAGAVLGSGGLSKSGTGTNTLSGINTFAGDIFITNGTLVLGGAGQLGGGAYSGAIADCGTLICNSTAPQTLAGIISGTGTLNQIGSGSLTLSAANTFSGPTTLTGGILQLANALALPNSILNYNGGNLTFSGITTATLGGLSGTQNLNLINDASAAVALTVGGANGTGAYTGVLSGTVASLTKTGTGGLILTGKNSYTGATTVNAGVLQLNAGGVINGGAANVAAVAGAQLVVSGGSLTADAPGNLGSGSSGLLVSSGSATFNAGLTTDLGGNNNLLIQVSGGFLTASSLALGRTGLSDTTQPTAGSTADGLYLNGGMVTITGNLNMGTTSAANSSASLRVDSGSLTVGGALTIGLNNGGRWSVVDVNGGSLTVNDPTTGISVGGPLAGNAELLVRAGSVTAGIIGLGQGTTVETAVVDLTGGSLYVGGGGIVQESSGAGFVSTVTLGGGTLGATANWSSSVPITLADPSAIQAADVSNIAHNIALGGILSGPGGLTKTGGGTLTLSGTNTYAGATTVNAGNLLVNGMLAAGGAVVVANGGTLGGTGVINGPAIIQNGGTLSPGVPFGTLMFSNSLALEAGATSIFAVSQVPLTNGVATISGTFTNGGTLIVTNLRPAALVAGDNFKLFNATGYCGAFANVLLPSLPVGLGWNTNNLDTSGGLSVIITAKPVIGSISISGNGLAFGGTGGAGYANYYVLSSTNLNLPPGNWTPLLTNQFDRSGNFSFTNAPAPDSPQSFYRLQLP